MRDEQRVRVGLCGSINLVLVVAHSIKFADETFLDLMETTDFTGVKLRLGFRASNNSTLMGACTPLLRQALTGKHQLGLSGSKSSPQSIELGIGVIDGRHQ